MTPKIEENLKLLKTVKNRWALIGKLISFFFFSFCSELPDRFALSMRNNLINAVKIIGAGFLLYFSCGCKTPSTISRTVVSDSLQKATGFTIQKESKPGVTALPPTVNAFDGINEEEAVSIALWNNPQLQADLANIAIAQADVIEAGIVSNPLLRYLAPSGGLEVSGYINFAFDFLFQRPKRIAAARTDALRVEQTSLQRIYTLIRDVQIAYTEFLLARERLAILRENAEIRKQMADLANSRLRNGDVSELEVTTFRADSASAQDDVLKAALDTVLRKNSLTVLMGFPADTTLTLQPTAFFSDAQKVVEQTYLQLAWEYQPELRAAQINMEAIGKRLGWERSRIISFIPTLNYQHIPGNGGSKFLPNAFNPGIQAEIPVLNRNQGRIARAKAEMEAAAYQYVATRQRIALDVSNAYQRYEQAWQSYQIWAGSTLPSLEEAVRLSQSSYRNGDISYLPVLEAQRQLLNAKLRRVEVQADIRRSVSGLNFSIGNKWNN
jgi:cobalt-zinc-cadmium efflux system outer membrane protein